MVLHSATPRRLGSFAAIVVFDQHLQVVTQTGLDLLFEEEQKPWTVVVALDALAVDALLLRRLPPDCSMKEQAEAVQQGE